MDADCMMADWPAAAPEAARLTPPGPVSATPTRRELDGDALTDSTWPASSVIVYESVSLEVLTAPVVLPEKINEPRGAAAASGVGNAVVLTSIAIVEMN